MRRLIVPAILAIMLSACAGGDDPVVDGSSPDEEPAESPDEAPDEPEAQADEDDGADAQDDVDPPAGDDPEVDEGTDDGTGDDSDDAPTPDAAALEDPCADHRDREGEAFIELIAPVDDQAVDGEVELVGCSSVYEGTVQYRVLDGDGATLDEGFTTAECGGPCIGEFREKLSLEAADGEPVAYIQVFWEDASDGSERDLVERIVVLQ